MKKIYSASFYLVTAVLAITIFSGCHISQKMGKHIAGLYGNEVPGSIKKQTVPYKLSYANNFEPAAAISKTVQKTSKVLPLIVYISLDYRHTTTLNPAIAVSNFEKALNKQSAMLLPQLAGRQLQLTIEQVPNSFSLIDKSSIILLFITTHNLYMEGDHKDLVVSYNLMQDGVAVKQNKITVTNTEEKTGIRFLQSWRSAISEYMSSYDDNVIPTITSLNSEKFYGIMPIS